MSCGGKEEEPPSCGGGRYRPGRLGGENDSLFIYVQKGLAGNAGSLCRILQPAFTNYLLLQAIPAKNACIQL
jgi:hypothetical protein